MKTIPLSALGPLAQELFRHFSDIFSVVFFFALSSRQLAITVSGLTTTSEAQSLPAYLNSNGNLGHTRHRVIGLEPNKQISSISVYKKLIYFYSGI